MFAGDWAQGWKSVSNGLPIVPYHFTPDSAGMPITRQPGDKATNSSVKIEDLQYRIALLHAEDDVRNLQHSYGYYVDQKMWTDVLDLFSTDGKFSLDGATYSGPNEIRGALEKWMGPEGPQNGILNERPNFHTMVRISPDGNTASTRGLEFGMLGDSNKHTAKWEFSIFHNNFVRDKNSGIWKIQVLNITRVMVADYAQGWGKGGEAISSHQSSGNSYPEFLDRKWRFSSTTAPKDWKPAFPSSTNLTTEETLADLNRRIARAAAFDETENVSAAYGFYADDIRCKMFADLHAKKGFKESPGTGWYVTPARIEKACSSRYGEPRENPQRSSVPFHWRPQPVIIASNDGRSAALRARILQCGTSSGSGGGFSGVFGFNGGMYHDQFVLEKQADGSTIRRLWSLSLDEFYWQSSSWDAGWAGVKRTSKRSDFSNSSAIDLNTLSPTIERRQSDFPPDVSLKDAAMAEREKGLSGGSGQRQAWPEWAPMWWSYRNPVTGRVPKYYWAPGCVPCRTAKPEWALERNGYQEPPTGPTLLTANLFSNGTLSITVKTGPEESATGKLEILDASGIPIAEAVVGKDGKAVVELQLGDKISTAELTIIFIGSTGLRPGKAIAILSRAT
jgi:hypothetical protein